MQNGDQNRIEKAYVVAKNVKLFVNVFLAQNKKN